MARSVFAAIVAAEKRGTGLRLTATEVVDLLEATDIAAVAERETYVTCPTCDGIGRRSSPATGVGPHYCTTCHGSGRAPPSAPRNEHEHAIHFHDDLQNEPEST